MARMIAQLHPFDTAIELTPVGEGDFMGRTTPDYANMVGPFGGITAATLVRAVQQHSDCLGEPVSITVNYAGPVTEGPFSISARAIRTNRTTQHWTLSLNQNGVVSTTATAVFGTRRETWAVTEASAPPAPPAETIAPEQFPEFIAWARNYEMRFVEGGLPGPDDGEQPNSITTLWARDSPARPLDYPALAALSDVFYPRVIRRLGRGVPAGTVSLTVYFHADNDLLASQSDHLVLATARSHRFGNGFHDQSAQLWGHDGALLATSHQLVYFKG